MSKEKYIYQISTNPISNNVLLLDQENATGLSIISDFYIITGMNNSVDETIESIKKSSLVYISGEIDATTFFELGLAASLGKQIYYVTDEQEDKISTFLPYALDNLNLITYDNFINLIGDI